MIDDLLFIVKVTTSPWLLLSYVVFLLSIVLLLRIQAKPNTLARFNERNAKNRKRFAPPVKKESKKVEKSQENTDTNDEDGSLDDLDEEDER